MHRLLQKEAKEKQQHDRRLDEYRQFHAKTLPELPEDVDEDDDNEEVFFETSDEDEEPPKSVPSGRSVVTPMHRAFVASFASASSSQPRTSQAFLRGAIMPGGAGIEQCGESDRYSDDEIRQARSILGLSATGMLSDTDLKTAFRKRALEIHPDKQPLNLKAWAHEEMAKLNQAYNLLIRRQRGWGPSQRRGPAALTN